MVFIWQMHTGHTVVLPGDILAIQILSPNEIVTKRNVGTTMVWIKFYGIFLLAHSFGTEKSQSFMAASIGG